MISKAGWRNALAYLGLAFAVGVTFGRVVFFDFVRWDDDINITLNPLLTAPWSRDLLARFFSADQTLRFKPLHWLADRWLADGFGFDPTAWHALNLLLHLTAALLFFHVLRRLILLLRGDGGGARAEMIAALGAAAWALQPLRAEVAAWATASTYSFATVWLLGSFACYLESVAHPTRRRCWLGLAWVLAVAGYASYPVALTYGVFLAVVDLWLGRALPRINDSNAMAGATGSGTKGRPGLLAVWFLFPAIVAAGLTVWTRYANPGIFTDAPSIANVGLGTRAITALASLTFLAGRAVWPLGLTPNVPPLDATGTRWWGLCALAAIALGMLLWAWQRRRTHPGFAAVCFGFALLSLPCLGLTERPTWPVDRYSYLAHLPLIAGGTIWLARRPRAATRMPWLLLAATVMVALGAVGAARQIRIWRDSDALFTHMTEDPKLADNPRQRGHVYVLWGRYTASIGRSARALELFARAREVYVAAMRAAVARGDYEEALALSGHLQRYFDLDGVMRRERGAWLLRLGRPAQAAVELRAARAALPNDARVAQLLGEAEAGGRN